MKKILLVAVAVAVINSVQSGIVENMYKVIDPAEESFGNLAIISDVLAKVCPNSTQEIRAAFVAVAECDTRSDKTLTICAGTRANTLKCTRPLLDVLEHCLPEKAKDLPEITVKGLVSAFDYMCKQSGESIIELANPCLWEDPGYTEELAPCMNKLIGIHNKHKDNLPSAAEACGIVSDLRNCIQTKINISCENQVTKNVALGLYDALLSPCS